MDQEIRAIRNDADHAWALAEYERYFDGEPQAGTPDADRFEVLGVLIRDYEAERWPVGPSDPIDLIRFAIEDMGRSQADLARILGSRSRASEILARKRGLTLDMIRTIAGEWHLPVEALARPYRLDAAPASAKARGVGAPRLRRTASRRYRFPPAIAPCTSASTPARRSSYLSGMPGPFGSWPAAASVAMPCERAQTSSAMKRGSTPSKPSGKVTIRALTRSVKAPSGFSSPGAGPQGCGGASSSPPRGANIAA
jgi:HTH-type transcriptional regulator/antitoxin HigA